MTMNKLRIILPSALLAGLALANLANTPEPRTMRVTYTTSEAAPPVAETEPTTTTTTAAPAPTTTTTTVAPAPTTTTTVPVEIDEPAVIERPAPAPMWNGHYRCTSDGQCVLSGEGAEPVQPVNDPEYSAGINAQLCELKPWYCGWEPNDVDESDAE